VIATKSDEYNNGGDGSAVGVHRREDFAPLEWLARLSEDGFERLWERVVWLFRKRTGCFSILNSRQTFAEVGTFGHFRSTLEHSF